MKIHVAKAKDLPISWYELILCPDKFRSHLETLAHNPDGVCVHSTLYHINKKIYGNLFSAFQFENNCTIKNCKIKVSSGFDLFSM